MISTILIERIAKTTDNRILGPSTATRPYVAVLATLAPIPIAHVLLIRDGSPKRMISTILIERIAKTTDNRILGPSTATRPYVAVLATLAPIPIAHVLLIGHGSTQPREPSMRIPRITKGALNHKTPIRTPGPYITILETLAFPSIWETCFSLNRISKSAFLSTS